MRNHDAVLQDSPAAHRIRSKQVVQFGGISLYDYSNEPFADMTGQINQSDLQSKLVLLMLSFPRLKIIWSSSPYFTAEVFEALKKNQEEPDPFTAVKVGLDPSET